MSRNASNDRLTHDPNLPYPPEEADYNDANNEKEHPDFDEYDDYNPKKPRFYRTKRFWIRCAILTVVLVAIFVPLLLFVILPKIAQSIINASNMEMKQLNMTDATETQVNVSVAGGITNAGIFSADITFPEDIVVSWQGKQLGSMRMAPVHASGGVATIADQTVFKIIDNDAFTTFSKQMLSIESFTWTLTSTVTIKALGQTVSNLKLSKDIVMLGMNGFSNVVVQSFEIFDSPSKNGALVKLTTSMNNPSPIGMTLGTIVLDMFYNGTYLGQVSADNSTLIGASSSPLALTGTLFVQTNKTDLDNVSTLMSNYLAGKVTLTSAKGVSVKPDGVNAVSWLSGGLTALTLTVPLSSPVAINVISDIKIANMGMVFNANSPWTPMASSTSVTAGFKLPWNITVGMQSVANTMEIVYKGKALGSINAAVWNPAASNIPAGIIAFTLPSSPMPINDDAHAEFTDFVRDLTLNPSQDFVVRGLASAVSTTPVGAVTLANVPFTSNITMAGLNFNTANAAVTDVKVIGGTSDHIIMSQMAALPNPSQLSVTGGQVQLVVYDGATDKYLGELVIPNLAVVPGNNPTPCQFLFHPTDATLRDSFLSQYLVGAVFPLKVKGTDASTPIAPLTEAMSLVSIQSSAPGLSPPPKLIISGTAVSTLQTLLGNRQTTTTVTMLNPLDSPLVVLGQKATVTWNGNFFGTINADFSANPVTVPAKGSIKTPDMILQHPDGAAFGTFLTFTFLPAYPAIALGGAEVPFLIESTISVLVGGGYAATITYSQANTGIMTTMKLL